jgi:tuberculosinol/isotuberculosinol synthase
MEHLDRKSFLALSTEEIAGIVRSGRSQVCVFPFNGTRRWFLLEHGDQQQPDPAKSYIEATSKGYIQIYRMLFDHGIDTVIAPALGSEILNRGREYMEQIGASMGLLAEHPYFTSFYREYDIRVHFYGDYRRELNAIQLGYISTLFDKAEEETAANRKHRLFYGVFASDATQTIAELSVEYYLEHKKIPSRAELINAYYGGSIERADLFIGFEKFTVFDYPMLNCGEENLYFTVAPSLYMSAAQLRNILYDHIYLRPAPEPDYLKMPRADFESMRRFYENNRDSTLGTGEVRGQIWYESSNIGE